MNKQKIIPVILCGGSGTRLWPASREKHPKQFLSLMNDFSLLQNTIRRGLRAGGPDASDFVIVTLAAMKDSVIDQLSEIDVENDAHILCEPSARNTAAAVAFAADYVAKTFGDDAIMWVLPADHHIGDEAALDFALAPAIAHANQNHLVTFGITPTRPDTGYGYILEGDALDDKAFKVQSFVEKPNLETARAYLESGNYLWNSGMFVFTAGEVLKQFDSLASDVLAAVRVATQDNAQEPQADAYNAIRSTPFDKAIMEKAGNVAVVPCNPRWSDIGSWESLWDIREKDQNNNAINGRAACVNAQGCLVHAQEKLIAIAGLSDIVVVETDDALLITQKSDGDSMKMLVNSLKSSGAREVIDSPVGRIQPWSMTKTVGEKASLNARELVVAPGDTLSLPTHEKGVHVLTVIHGSGTVDTHEESKLLAELQAVQVSATADAAIRNDGAAPMVVICVYRAAAEGIFFGAANDSRKVA